MSDAAAAHTHGNAYSDDPNYEDNYGLFGAPVEVIRYDWTVRAWRKMVVQPLRRASDPIDVADPDVQLEDEPWEREAVRPTKQRRRKRSFTHDNPVQGMVTDLLLEHGPSVSHSIAERTGVNYFALNAHIRLRKGVVYCEVGRRGKSVIWGLVGVHDAT